MKIRAGLIITSLLITLMSCKKDPIPVASADQTDPFIRYDNVSNVDHQIYLIYNNTHVPILYSDTIQKNPVTTLSINYHIGGPDGGYRVVYLKQDADKLAGVNFINTRILPHLTKNAKPYSVLLTDSVVTKFFSFVTFKVEDKALIAYFASNTLAIGSVTKITAMSPDSLKSYSAYIFAAQLTGKLNSGIYSSLLNSFYSVSATYYAQTINAGGMPKEAYGLITIGNEGSGSYFGGTQADDFTRYLRLFLTNDYPALQVKYKSYPLVINKLAYLQTALNTLGYVP